MVDVILCKVGLEMNQIDAVINNLYKNNAKELQRICNKEMIKFGGISNMDYDDFYSRVGYDISLAKDNFDSTKGKSFKDYIYGVIKLSIWKEMRHRNREKRQISIEVEDKDVNGEIKKHKEYVSNISIDTPIGDKENYTISDMLFDEYTVENEIFDENEESYSNKMNQYLNRLSILQKEVLKLISIGFVPSEIINELHINKKQYDDCYAAIHSYRNISILM